MTKLVENVRMKPTIYEAIYLANPETMQRAAQHVMAQGQRCDFIDRRGQCHLRLYCPGLGVYAPQMGDWLIKDLSGQWTMIDRKHSDELEVVSDGE